MKLRFLFAILLALPAFGQISGAGQLGCIGTPITGTAWTSATGVNATQTPLVNSSAWGALIQLNQTTTLTGGDVTFEQSFDGTNFVSVPTSQLLSPTTGLPLTNPYTFVASTNQPFLIHLAGASTLRVRLSTVIAGTGSVTPFTTALCSPLTATQFGTWTVQPGNTANTTAWKVDGSAVTQPVSAASLPLPAGAATETTLGTRLAEATFTTRINTQGQKAMTASTPVVLASDQASVPVAATLPAETTKVIGTVRFQGNLGAAIDAATGAAPPANAVLVAGLTSGATGGFMTAIPVCDSFADVNIVTIATTLEITGVSGRHIRICSLNLVAAGAQNVGIISGTGATCGTGTAAIVGTTAATGFNFASNGGISAGSGIGTIFRTVAAGDSVCLVTSAAVQLSGNLAYAIY